VSPVDHEEIDAYILGPTEPLTEFEGVVIGIVVRLDDEIKLIVSDGRPFTSREIEEAVHFQEQYYKHSLLLP